MSATETAIRQVIEEVLKQLGKSGAVGSAPTRSGDFGVFPTVDQAVDAATVAFKQLTKKGIEARAKAIECWDGGPNRRGERLQASLALCFGADRPGRELVDGAFGALADTFHGPLLERLELVKA